MQLSFGEQVKIVLKRQGITIKELASRIEEQTGKKMSRQNLTQRLGRDNFQEQDMFMVARALGCTLTINLLDEQEQKEAPAAAAAPEPAAAVETAAAVEPAAAEPAAAAETETAEKVTAAAEPETTEEAPPITPESVAESVEELEFEEEKIEEERAEKKRSRRQSWFKMGRRHADEEPVQEEAPAPAKEPELPAEEPELQEIKEEELTHEELMRELNADIEALGDAGTIELDDIPERRGFDTDPEAELAFEREKEALLTAQKEDRNAELPADQLPSTSVNPYTLREYKSNTVRAHASRIGYVQVYSRQEHAWIDMTEWAFMGEQERRRALLGDQYEEPTYLD